MTVPSKCASQGKVGQTGEIQLGEEGKNENYNRKCIDLGRRNIRKKSKS